MLSDEQRRRLEQEKNSFEQSYELQSEKIARLRNALVIETDPSRKFQYEQQIKNEDTELKRLTDRLDEIEKQLQSAQSIPVISEPKSIQQTNMSLSGQQRKELQLALIDAFPNTASLEQMLAFELDKNLRAIAGEGSLQDIVFKLIQTANSQGWIEDLVRAACASNPGNPKLRDIARGLLPNHDPETSSVSSPNIPQKQKAPIVWSETKGSIGEYKEGVIPVKSTKVNLRNFIVEALFDNPYDGEAYNWTYGFAFQENTSNKLNDPQRKSFDIWITSKEKKWCFGTTNRYSDGYLSNLNVFDQSSNKLHLRAEGKIAIFYLNDVYIETFDISNFINKGDIFLIAKDGISGKSIQYKNLKVWSLDD
ncbi:MAG: effector-associated domain EAD1-containing protein [Nostoc sp. DcaGUA01]|nr:effector-associated domain EAD1-containing protein [Nostoc sp. DcaGUA01]